MMTQLDPVNAQGKRRKVKNTWSGTAPISGETCPTSIQLGLPGPARCTPRLLKEEICETNSTGGTELTCGTSSSFVRTFTYFGATSLVASETVTNGLNQSPLTTTYTYDNAGRLLSENGPRAGSDDAMYYRYDVLGRRTWEIGPKGENGRRPASWTTYRNADDQITEVKTGTVPGGTTDSSPSGDPSLTVISDTDTTYNSRRLATSVTVRNPSGSPQAVTQMTYDGLNRSDCTAVRMNLSSLPSNACAVGTLSSNGPDRITRNHYDTESRVIRIEQGVGSSDRRDYATYTFTPNGQMASMTDARGYMASMTYDGFDRQKRWYFPNPNVTGAINSADFEEYGYDNNGNRTSLRKRDGSTLTYQYDNLNRVTRKIVPSRAGLNSTHTRDVFYQYDIRGLQTHARFDSLSGQGLYNTYDMYGRMTLAQTTMDGATRNINYYYNVDSSLNRIRYPDGQFVRYNYSSGGQFNQVLDNGFGLIVDFNYNTDNELSQLNWSSTAPDQNFTYDAIGRLASTGWSNAGGNNVTWSFTRNPASQIKSETQTNNSYSWDGHSNFTRNYATNGLNQYTSVNGQTYCHDKNGNLTLDGTYVYLYDVENRLVEMRAKANTNCNALSYGGQLKAKLRYDPAGRLHETINYVGGVATDTRRYLHDRNALFAEYNTSGTMLARYVHGPNASADDPLAEYAGSSMSAGVRTNLYSDARGSIVLRTSSTGGSAQINSYDEYGQPSTSNVGRHQYTGQIWLPELGMYYYKARIYSPKLGRFMQTDPIGYEGGVNLYGYAKNDPINKLDPDGLAPVALVIPVVRCGLNAGCRTAVASGARFVVRRAVGVFTSDNANDGDRDKIYDISPSGKIKNKDLDVPIADKEVDQAIKELKDSIEQRKKENDEEPRGNPNGNRQEREQAQARKGHKERIKRESDKLEELEERKEVKKKEDEEY